MPGIGAETREQAEHGHHCGQHPGRTPANSAADNEEGVDREAAKSEDQGHDIAVPDAGIHQGTGDHNIKPDRHREERPGDCGDHQQQRARLAPGQCVRRQEVGDQRPEHTGQDHQRHGDPDDEPEVPCIIADKTRQGRGQVLFQKNTVIITGRRGRLRPGTPVINGAQEFFRRNETAQDRHTDENDQQAERHFGHGDVEGQDGEGHRQHDEIQGRRGHHGRQRRLGPRPPLIETLGNRRGAIDANAKRRPQHHAVQRIGEGSGETAPPQIAQHCQEGGAHQQAERHALLVGIDPVDRGVGPALQEGLVRRHRDHRLEAERIFQRDRAGHHRLFIQ